MRRSVFRVYRMRVSIGHCRHRQRRKALSAGTRTAGVALELPSTGLHCETQFDRAQLARRQCGLQQAADASPACRMTTFATILRFDRQLAAGCDHRAMLGRFQAYQLRYSAGRHEQARLRGGRLCAGQPACACLRFLKYSGAESREWRQRHCGEMARPTALSTAEIMDTEGPQSREEGP